MTRSREPEPGRSATPYPRLKFLATARKGKPSIHARRDASVTRAMSHSWTTGPRKPAHQLAASARSQTPALYTAPCHLAFPEFAYDSERLLLQKLPLCYKVHRWRNIFQSQNHTTRVWRPLPLQRRPSFSLSSPHFYCGPPLPSPPLVHTSTEFT